jgi:hypothetical protein
LFPFERLLPRPRLLLLFWGVLRFGGLALRCGERLGAGLAFGGLAWRLGGLALRCGVRFCDGFAFGWGDRLGAGFALSGGVDRRCLGVAFWGLA